MSVAGRTFLLVLSAGLVLAGLVMIVMLGEGAWLLIATGLVLALSVLIEGRYRRGSGDVIEESRRWQRTAEREVDSETGEIVEVWFDPVSGCRRYEPQGRLPEEM